MSDRPAALGDLRAVVLRGVVVVGLALVVSVASGWSVSSAVLVAAAALIAYIGATLGRNVIARRRLAQITLVTQDDPAWNCQFIDGPLHGKHARLSVRAMRQGRLDVPLLVDGRTHSFRYVIDPDGQGRVRASLSPTSGGL